MIVAPASRTCAVVAALTPPATEISRPNFKPATIAKSTNGVWPAACWSRPV